MLKSGYVDSLLPVTPNFRTRTSYKLYALGVGDEWEENAISPTWCVTVSLELNQSSLYSGI
jgi:hypothetical protein